MRKETGRNDKKECTNLALSLYPLIPSVTDRTLGQRGGLFCIHVKVFLGMHHKMLRVIESGVVIIQAARRAFETRRVRAVGKPRKKAKSRPDSYSQQTGARLNASQNVTCAEGLGSFTAKRSLTERGERFLEERPDRQTDITHIIPCPDRHLDNLSSSYVCVTGTFVRVTVQKTTHYSPARLPRPLTSSNVKLFYTIASVI